MQSRRSVDDQLVSRAEIARLAGVKRPTVTIWQSRHPAFPEPVRSGDAEYFRLVDILAWLEGRTIPASARMADEPATTTYADRVRRNQHAALPQPQGATPADFVVLDDTKTRQRLNELMGPLAGGVRGAGSAADYLSLLFSLVLLHGCAFDQWYALSRQAQSMVSQEDAERLLGHIGRSADEVLRRRGLLPGVRSSLLRLQPRTYQNLAEVIRLSSGLGRSAFRLLLDLYEVRSALNSSEFFTPYSVAQLMARLLLPDIGEQRRIYDPYARGGELLAAAADASHLCASRPVMRAESPHRDTLQLAGMHLALHGLPAQVVTIPSTPWDEADWPRHKADLILTNPPFNSGGGVARARKDDEWPYGPPPVGNDTFAWIQHVLASLDVGGRAAVLMPNQAGVSANQHERDVRREIVERGALECVIALPSKLFSGTPIAVSLWLLKYPENSCEQVLFIDARGKGVKSGKRRTLTEQDRMAVEDAFHSWRDDREYGLDHAGREEFSVSVGTARIRSNGYLLNPPDYLPRKVGTAPTAAAGARALMDTRAEALRLRTLARDADAKVDRLCFSSIPKIRDRLPAGWQRKPLHTLCDIQPGPSYSRLRAADRSADGVVPVVFPKHISDRRIIDVDHDKVSLELADDLGNFRLKTGDIVCVRSGTTGPSALVDEHQAGWLSSTNLLRLHRYDAHEINPGYLLGYLSRPEVVEWVQNRSRASTATPSISAQSLGELLVVLPPLPEQQRIGAALMAFDEQIAAHLEFAQTAERIRATLAEHLVEGVLAVD